MPSTYERLAMGRYSRWLYADLDASLDSGAPRFASMTARTPDLIMESPYRIPLPGESVDVVVAGQVLEHVPAIWRFVGELARVLRSNGRMILIAPVSWPYHEAPVDCWRIYPDGMLALFNEAGVEPETCIWTSLEFPSARKRRPGMTSPVSLRSRIRNILGLPIEVAFDTLAVGRKR